MVNYLKKSIFLVGLLFLLTLGFFLGHSLAHHPKLEAFKLLNLVGLTYELLGLFTLTEAVLGSQRWRKFFTTWIAGLLFWGQSVLPLGAAAGAGFAGPTASSGVASNFFIAFWVCSMVPLILFDAVVFFPGADVRSDIETRTRRMGFGLLVAGGLVQLLAAFKDLYA